MDCLTEALNVEGPFGVRLCDDMLNTFCDRVQMIAPRRVNGFFAIQSISRDPTLQAQIKPGDDVIQIIFDQYRHHYITVYLTFEDVGPLLRVYDPLLNEASMKDRHLKDMITSSVVRQILDIFGRLDCQKGRNQVLVEHVYDIDPQMDNWSCGYRCIGVILDLLQNRDPSRSLYEIRTIYNLYQWVNQRGVHSWEDIISFPYRSKRYKTGAGREFLWLNEDVFESIRDREIEQGVTRREFLKRESIDRTYSHQCASSLNTKDRLKPYAPEQSGSPMAATDSSSSHLQNRLAPYLSDDPVDWHRKERKNEKKRWEWRNEDKDEDQELQQMQLLQRVNRARYSEYNHNGKTNGFMGSKVSSQPNIENISFSYRNLHSTIKQSSNPKFPSAGAPIGLQDSNQSLQFKPEPADRNGATMFGGFDRLSVQRRTNSEDGRNAVGHEEPWRRRSTTSLQRSCRKTRIIDVGILETTWGDATYEVSLF